MAETKFTPGPYTITKHSWSDTSIYGPEDKHILTMSIYDDATEENQEEMEQYMAAQMALFAAAPEMYEAMQSFCKDFQNDYVVPDGRIVDNPQQILVQNYNMFQAILSKANVEK